MQDFNVAELLKTKTISQSVKGIKFSYICEYTKKVIKEVIVEKIFFDNYQCESGAIYDVNFIVDNLK